jgi:hypothetical protein
MTLRVDPTRSFHDRRPSLLAGSTALGEGLFRSMLARDFLILASCGVVVAGMMVWVIWLGRHVK